MTQPRTANPPAGRSLRAPVLWGVVFGGIQAAAPLGFTGHGFKDLWQHRRHYVANPRWWPPFCLVVDWVAAAILALLITVGVPFHP
jgi:hypothetical protein